MKWIKKGWIYKPKGSRSWSRSHAQVPFAIKISDNRVRIYFATRNSENCSATTFIEVNASNPSEVFYEHDHPCIEKGDLGAFDDAGVMPSWFLEYDGKMYLYYTGWNKSDTISYRLSIGLAISEDGGVTFKKRFSGPIMDRSINDPFWVAQPCVMIESNIWKMWYLSCEKVKLIHGHPEPFYNVKYAESRNGIHWDLSGITSIDFDEFTDAIGRPYVIQEEDKYKMIYSYRSATNYRTDRKKSYRFGYAESMDGIRWKRKDNNIFMARSLSGWDSVMNEYCSFYEHNGRKYMLYNGNDFGGSGFGYAMLVK